ncbi:unnamed protein product, partial [Closterium sp. NIES-64]
SLPPARLSTIFKDSLSPPLLAAVLSIILSTLFSTDAPATVALLSAFPSVPRFPILLVCVPPNDKQRLSTLWDEALSASTPATATYTTLQQLRSAYKL